MNTHPNEPAFPRTESATHDGLTKREYFAAMAMQGFIINMGSYNLLHENYALLASSAVKQADALITELNKRKP